MTFDEISEWLVDRGFSIENPQGFETRKFPLIAQALTHHTCYLPPTASAMTRIRAILEGYRDAPLCYCGNVRIWQKKSFSDYCSVRCAQNCPKVRGAALTTLKSRHGGDAVWDNLREKRLKTMTEKHGSFDKANEVRMQTMRANNLDRYGVEHTFQVAEVKEKIAASLVKRFGGHPLSNSAISNEAKDKQKETMVKRHGVEYGVQTEFARTRLAENFSENKEDILFRTRATLERRYGGHHMKIPEVIQKREGTNVARYGVAHPAQKHLVPTDVDQFHSDDEFSMLYQRGGLEAILALGYSRDRTIARAYRLGLLDRYRSAAETDIGIFLEQCGLEWETTRSIIAPYELDFYVPSHNVAIEYCGVYWHSERFKDRFYHHEKMAMCRDKGIRLLTIYESEWIYRREQVQSSLRSIFGLNKTIGARLTSVACLDYETARAFLDQNHIQGSSPRFTICYGLLFEGEVVAAMAFTKTKSEWELIRFCSIDNVVGAASKLLAHFKKNNDWQTIKSFADLRWSNGDLYHQLGFNLEKELPPDYGYVIRDKVEHKFRHRKKFYADRYDVENMTEREITKAEGLNRIYDCGKLRFRVFR